VAASLLSYFSFAPTPDQARLFALLTEFLRNSAAGNRPTFLLTGYAGTGKTSVVSALVQALPALGYDCILLAPTGRAAKVLGTYAGRPAHTIHKQIYRQSSDGSGGPAFQLLPNRARHTVYVVDEASMIADEASFGERGLLTDLLAFVFGGEGTKPNNRLLLIGDPAQLPPVGQTASAALDAGILAGRFRCAVTACILRQVMRQSEESGILTNATALRDELLVADPKPQLHTHNQPGIWAMSGERLEDGLRYAYDKFGTEGTTIICRSNKQANLYNQLIRRVIFDAEDELQGGDYLMIARNNYYWLPTAHEMGFLANGDFAEVRRVRRIEELHGFRFADVRLRFVDYPGNPELDVKLLLDSLHAEAPALPAADAQRLYQAVQADYADLSTKAARLEGMRKDPYFNALQAKFAYALTCHKAQGGQWGAVFLDHGYLKPEIGFDAEFIRWLYTALTRAEREVFLLNFKKELLADVQME
jgi:ATP-dependent exoDNAse (exonuclease V) alpha subunit